MYTTLPAAVTDLQDAVLHLPSKTGKHILNFRFGKRITKLILP